MNGGLQAKGQGSEDKGPEESSQVPGFLLKVCAGKTRSCRCHSLGPCHHYLLSLGHRRLGGGISNLHKRNPIIEDLIALLKGVQEIVGGIAE